jgi:hypothetical protein
MPHGFLSSIATILLSFLRHTWPSLCSSISFSFSRGVILNARISHSRKKGTVTFKREKTNKLSTVNSSPQPLHTITIAIYKRNASLFDFIFFLICLSLCFLFLFGELGLVVLGIGGNGADFRDIFRDHLWNRVDGWSLNGNT